jgi:hypothetical protein
LWGAPQVGDHDLPPNATIADVRQAVRDVAEEIGEWAGLPIPLDDHTVVFESNHPLAGTYLYHLKPRDGNEEVSITCRGQFWLPENEWIDKYGRRVELLVDIESGERSWSIRRHNTPINRLNLQLRTMMTAQAWDLEAEYAARDKLRSLVDERQFHAYEMTGMFNEVSKRSTVTYVFRKLRPTLALADESKVGRESPAYRVIAALCMHPIAYYQSTFSGALTPTDDVIAHLMTMRGDEHYFWRKANNHSLDEPESGV